MDSKADETALDDFLEMLTDKELFAMAQEAIVFNDKPMQEKCRNEMAKRKPKK